MPNKMSNEKYQIVYKTGMVTSFASCNLGAKQIA
jgi:hypothetical protein